MVGVSIAPGPRCSTSTTRTAAISCCASTTRARGEVRRHLAAWQFSQFMHGEQGALICTAKIVQTVPDIDSKFYAATQVIDEARHVEVYSRYLHEKLQMAYPISPPLKTLLDQGISDTRWDVT